MSESSIHVNLNRSKRSRLRMEVNYKVLAGEEYPDDDILQNSFASYKNHQIYKEKPTDKLGLYGNKHIRLIVNNDFDDITAVLQIVSDGTQLTAEALYEGQKFNIHTPLLVTDTPESLGMSIPKCLTVRNVAQCIGYSYSINVMDVSTQEELPDWTLKDLVSYFECPIRKKKLADYNNAINNINTNDDIMLDPTNLPKILNQISLEFSRTPLIRRVQSPKFVRDIDWIDNAWPQSRKEENEYPQVQYYCLTSTEGCFTDFHIDFGGTSVWYHVLSGEKVFLLIEPTDDNLKLYEEWICNPKQGSIFFANFADKCYKVKLEAGKTFIIPTGWIHAVYTPIDSVVIGGNFLHSLDIKGQLNVHCIETRTNVPQKFRFPLFKQINFFAASMLLQKLRKGKLHMRERKNLPSVIEAIKLWNVAPGGDDKTRGSIPEVASYAARLAKCPSAIYMINALKLASESPSQILNDKTPKESLSLRINVKRDRSVEFTTPENIQSTKFQIFVPKEPVYTLKPENKIAKHVAEGVNYVSNGSDFDDEWKPKSRKKARKKLRISKILLNKKEVESSMKSDAGNPNTSKIDNKTKSKKVFGGPITMKKKKGTVRDRLLKRFGR